MIIDSWFDAYLGVVSLVRVVEGTLKKGDKIKVFSTGRERMVDDLGVFTPKAFVKELRSGEVGYVCASIKDIFGTPVGDTIVHAKHGATESLPGFQSVKPQVYAGLYPVILMITNHFVKR